MNEQIKFDGKYYLNIRDYLDSHKDLHGIAIFGGDGKIYKTSRKNRGDMKGLILQRCGDNDKCMVSIINEHPSFAKIKSDLEDLTKK